MNLDARFDAICELYPETGSVENGVNVFDSNGKPIDIDESKIKPVYEKKLAEYNLKKYQFDRLNEYPSIQECIHAILDNDLTELQAKRKRVKEKYPKP